MAYKKHRIIKTKHMKTYIVTITHNQWEGSLERYIKSPNIETAKATVIQTLIIEGRLKEWVINIIPA